MKLWIKMFCFDFSRGHIFFILHVLQILADSGKITDILLKRSVYCEKCHVLTVGSTQQGALQL